MKLDSKIITEAERASRNPQFKYLILGMFCGVMIPTMYARHSNMLPQLSKDSIEYFRSFSRDNRSKTPLEIEEENMLISSIL